MNGSLHKMQPCMLAGKKSKSKLGVRTPHFHSRDLERPSAVSWSVSAVNYQPRKRKSLQAAYTSALKWNGFSLLPEMKVASVSVSQATCRSFYRITIKTALKP